MSLLLEVPWKNDPVGRMTPCMSLNSEDDYYNEKARQKGWDEEAQLMFSQYNLTKGPGNWRKLPMVKILEELIAQRIQWYEDLKKTWIGMPGVQYVGIEDMDDFERDEIMHLRWQMLR